MVELDKLNEELEERLQEAKEGVAQSPPTPLPPSTSASAEPAADAKSAEYARLEKENDELRRHLAELRETDAQRNAGDKQDTAELILLRETSSRLERELEEVKASRQTGEDRQREEIALLSEHIQRLEAERSEMEERLSREQVVAVHAVPEGDAAVPRGPMEVGESVDYKLRLEHMENEKFSMNEQIKDLKIQVLNKQGEIGELRNKMGMFSE